MNAISIYRACVWLPLVVPAIVIVIARLFDVRLSDGVVLELLMYSMLYGAVPYALLAVWAMWWVRDKTEAQIRRLMLRAPLMMLALFAAIAVVAGVVTGRPGPFLAVAMLGTAIILPLGYAYVGLTIALRRVFGPPPTSLR